MNESIELLTRIAEIQSQYLQLTENMIKKIFTEMNKETITILASGKLPIPTKILQRRKIVKSTRKMSESTEVSSHKNNSNSSRKTEEDESKPAGLTTKDILSADKKFKVVMSMLHNFEERCISNKVMGKQKHQDFRNHSRGCLGHMIHNSEAVNYKSSDRIGLAILLHSAIKVGMSKKNFLGQAQPIAKNKNLRISFIRKSKCYAILKNLIAKSDEEKLCL